jgi:large subunit ribosomal protein L24e
MPKCVYCGTVYDIPRGLTLVMNDGRIQYLCSSKCRKNMLMKRRKVRWVSKSDKGVALNSDEGKNVDSTEGKSD